MDARVASRRKARRAASIAAAAAIIMAALAPGAAGTGARAAGGAATAAAVFPSPAPTITAGAIARVPGTLKPGSVVRSSALGHRVFVDGQHGFALASVGQAQYPAASVNGGRTWRTSGPALHLNAAQAPLAVCEMGALDRRVYFAAGCGEVVDTTNDGGRHWWRALFGGGVLGVVGSGGRLLAFIEAVGEGGPAVTWVYVSSDGGRHWQYEPNL